MTQSRSRRRRRMRPIPRPGSASVGKGRADGLDDDRLAEVVDLGDDVLLALVDDALESLVAVALDDAGGLGSLDGDLELAFEVRSGTDPMLRAEPLSRR